MSRHTLFLIVILGIAALIPISKGFRFLRIRTHKHFSRIAKVTTTESAPAFTTAVPKTTPRQRQGVPMSNLLLKQPILGVSPWWNINDVIGNTNDRRT